MRGEGIVAVGDKTFSLVYDCNAICVLEQTLGMTFADFSERAKRGEMWFAGIRALFFAGMQRNYKSMTLERCGDLLSDGDFNAITAGCIAALTGAFPKPNEGNAEAAGEIAKSGTGSCSLPPLAKQA